MQRKKTHAKKNATQTAGTHPGGREFGNVIEPMQAQMASGNKGLAGDSGGDSPQSAAKKPVRKSGHAA